jgi:predicted O-methyltransferase YrrM
VQDFIARLFENPELLRMGHAQRLQDLNLGLGWLYYALGRVLRPKCAVVIGSYRGFVPLVLGKALSDNGEGGEVIFIDPSHVDDFWKDRRRVSEYFAGLGITNIRHFLMTTQEFVKSEAYRALNSVGLVFVDGYHTEQQVRFDYESFRELLEPNGVMLFHDSARIRSTRIYGPGKEYEHRVKSFVDGLKQDARLELFDLPFGAGVTLLRKIEASAGCLSSD